jgi:hypothetical protein
MKLIYRGVSYEYNPPQVEYGDRAAVGKYRGVDIRFRNIQKAPVLKPTLDLIYRGSTYKVDPAPAPKAETAPRLSASDGASDLIYRGATYKINSAPAPEAKPAPALSISDRARVLMMDHHRSVKRRQQAMLARTDAQVGLDAKAASSFWNHIQGTAHPSFNDNYDRSHAALS